MDRAVFTPRFTPWGHGLLDDHLASEYGGSVALVRVELGPEQLPGWLRLTLPVAISLALWAAILITWHSLS